MRTGQYDGVSASGNATARLVDGGDVAPVNIDLVPNYKTVFADLKDQPYNTFDGVNYGIPHGRGANLLMWNTDDVKPAPTSWDVILDPKKAAKYKGKISVYDDPIYIADAARVPEGAPARPRDRRTRTSSNEEQFNAAVDLLKEQRPNVGEYWSDSAKQISSFANGDARSARPGSTSTSRCRAKASRSRRARRARASCPKEGATGWSDTWMISSEAEHPNCMYMWMNHIIDPKANAKVAEWFGEAPAQSKACEFKTADQRTSARRKLYHADNPEFWKRVYYWKTPLADCGDDRGEVCKDYNDWVPAWTEIKG